MTPTAAFEHKGVKDERAVKGELFVKLENQRGKLAGLVWGLEQSRDDRELVRRLLVIADFGRGQGGPTFVRDCERSKKPPTKAGWRDIG